MPRRAENEDPGDKGDAAGGFFFISFNVKMGFGAWEFYDVAAVARGFLLSHGCCFLLICCQFLGFCLFIVYHLLHVVACCLVRFCCCRFRVLMFWCSQS